MDAVQVLPNVRAEFANFLLQCFDRRHIWSIEALPDITQPAMLVTARRANPDHKGQVGYIDELMKSGALICRTQLVRRLDSDLEESVLSDV